MHDVEPAISRRFHAHDITRGDTTHRIRVIARRGAHGVRTSNDEDTGGIELTIPPRRGGRRAHGDEQRDDGGRRGETHPRRRASTTPLRAHRGEQRPPQHPRGDGRQDEGGHGDHGHFGHPTARARREQRESFLQVDRDGLEAGRTLPGDDGRDGITGGPRGNAPVGEEIRVGGAPVRGFGKQLSRARILTLLVQGGTSGIGVTAIQMAKALGAQVIATAGSDEKCAACLALGADHAINYKTADFSLEAKRLTDGKGVNVILDMVAGSYVAREVECLAEYGRLVIIAVQGGVKAEFNAGMVLRKRLSITGSTLRPRPIAFKTAIAQSLRTKVWPLLESGVIKPVIYKTFAADAAAQAHALMESNQHIGKIILTWSGEK